MKHRKLPSLTKLLHAIEDAAISRRKPDDLEIDAELLPRTSGVEWMTCAKYADAMRAGATFPPVTAVQDGERVLILDGAHRQAAAKRAGLESLAVRVIRWPRDEWVWAAGQLNSAHGRPLTLQDRIALAARLLRDGYEPAGVASMMSLSLPMMEEKIGRIVDAKDGENGTRPAVLKSAVAHLAGTRHARLAFASQGAVANAALRRNVCGAAIADIVAKPVQTARAVNRAKPVRQARAVAAAKPVKRARAERAAKTVDNARAATAVNPVHAARAARGETVRTKAERAAKTGGRARADLSAKTEGSARAGWSAKPAGNARAGHVAEPVGAARAGELAKPDVQARPTWRTPEQEARLRRVRLYQRIVRLSTMQTLGVRAMQRNGLIDESEEREMLNEVRRPLRKRADKVMRDLFAEVKTWPVYSEWAAHIKGVGPALAVQWIVWFDPIAEWANVAKVWRFSGLGVVNGESERRRKGEKLHYVNALKTLAHQTATSFVKAGGWYRRAYDRYRERDEAAHAAEIAIAKPGLKFSPGHLHLRAMRYSVKLFLSHLWSAWRELEGLPTRIPYPVEYRGHTTIISHWEPKQHDQHADAGEIEAPEELIEV